MGAVTLPNPGGDLNVWGTKLNTFLSENVFDSDGYLSDPVLVQQYLQHRGDADTQIEFDTDLMKLHVGGVEMLRLLEDGTQDKVWINPAAVDVDTIISALGAASALFVQGSTGNVGIGTASPAKRVGYGYPWLHIKSAAPGIHLEDSDASTRSRYIDNNNGALEFGEMSSDGSSSVPHLTVAHLGKVGIGYTAPEQLLHVRSTTGNAYILADTSSGGGNAGLILESDDSQQWLLYTPDTSNDFRINSDSTDYFTIDTSGNVGIGTGSPDSSSGLTLEVANDTAAKIILNNTNASGVKWALSSSSTGNLGFYDYDSAAYRMAFDDSGNLGIGTVNPETLLHLWDSGTGPILRLAFGDTAVTTGDYYGRIEFHGNDQTSPGNTDGVRAMIAAYADSPYSSGQSNLLFYTAAATAATEKMRIDQDGKVGIGTSSPAELLEVSSNTGQNPIDPTVIRISTTKAAASNWLTTTDWGRFEFYSADESSSGPKVHWSIGARCTSTTGGLSNLVFGSASSSEAVVFTDAGDVGIGIAAPNYEFHLYKSTNNQTQMVAENPNTGTGAIATILAKADTGSCTLQSFSRGYSGTWGGVALANACRLRTDPGASVLMIGTGGTGDDLHFLTEDTLAMTIDGATQNVGISTSSPGSTLEVNGTLCATTIGSRDDSSTYHSFYLSEDNTYDKVWIGSNRFRYYPATDQFARTDAADLASMVLLNADDIEFYNQSAGTSGTYSLTPTMIIQGTGSGKGNVGIGTATPATKLHISASNASGVANALRFTDTDGGSSAEQFSGLIEFYTNDVTQVGVHSSIGGITEDTNCNGALVFYTGQAASAAERVRIDSSGDVGIGTASPDMALDVNGEIRASTGILFGSDTAAANTLDDYEEGTWTITCLPATSGTVTLANTTCRYIKIGAMVTCQGYIEVSSISSPVGDLQFSLPFQNSNDGFRSRSIGTVMAQQCDIDANAKYLISFMIENQTYFSIRECFDNASADTIDGADLTAGDKFYFSFSYVPKAS